MNNKYQDFINKLYELRQSSIEKEGEYGTGNLVFKEFRNKGYLDNLKDLSKRETSKTLTLESYSTDNQIGDTPFEFQKKEFKEFEQIWYQVKGVCSVICLKELGFLNGTNHPNAVLLYIPPVTETTVENCKDYATEEIKNLSTQQLQELFEKLNSTFIKMFNVQLFANYRYLICDFSLEGNSPDAQEFIELLSEVLNKIYKDIVE